MDTLNAIILGIVQGLTEFLPVSSSGHLVLLRNIFGISEAALFFDTMLHAGTLVAVFIVLRKDIWALLRRPVQPLTGYLILATIPAVMAALFFGDVIEHAFETGRFLGFAFLATSAVLVTAEMLSRRARSGDGLKNAEKMTWLDSHVIGVLQAIAIMPGFSRSGATISGALSMKLDRDFAARFSFLLSIPAILGAVVLQTAKLAKAAGTAAGAKTATGTLVATGAETGISAAAVIAGTIAAAIVGFFAIRFMIKIIREKSLYGFAIYTGILGILVLIDQFGTKIVFK